MLQSQARQLTRVTLKASLRTSELAAFATVSLLISAAPTMLVALRSIKVQTKPDAAYKGLDARKH